MNITTYLMDEEAHRLAYDALVIDQREHIARLLTDLELHHWGFSPNPPWQDGSALHFDVIHTERVLSNEVARLKTAERIAELEAAGEVVNAKRAKEIKRAITDKLIREAPQRHVTIPVVMNPALGMVMVGTAKAGDAEAVLSLLRHELGSFPALPLASVADVPQLYLTEALLQHNDMRKSPNSAFPLRVGERATLELPGDKGKVRFTDMSLNCEEVAECLRNGMRVASLGVVKDEVVVADIDKALVLRGFDVTDVAEERMQEEIDRWGNDAMRVIRFGEAAKLLCTLAAWMGVEQPLAPRQKAA